LTGLLKSSLKGQYWCRGVRARQYYWQGDTLMLSYARYSRWACPPKI